MNIPLLDRLRAAGGGFVPWTELGLDSAAATADLDELEAFGFGLERDPGAGVAFRHPAPRLCPDQIEWQLDTRRIGRRVAVWNRVVSTNDLALRAAASRANEGLVILAEEQTAGRGRLGRSWTAPPASSILMSVLLFPPGALDTPAWLTALGAAAAAEVLDRACPGHQVTIKWPNDVRINGSKIAGILVERGAGLGAGAVVGIGLNVDIPADRFPEPIRTTATSLRILLNRPVDRSELARELIQHLDRLYAEGLQHGPAPLLAAWQARLEHAPDPPPHPAATPVDTP